MNEWDDWDKVEVGKSGKVKAVPRGRKSKADSSVILSDPHGEA